MRNMKHCRLYKEDFMCVCSAVSNSLQPHGQTTTAAWAALRHWWRSTSRGFWHLVAGSVLSPGHWSRGHVTTWWVALDTELYMLGPNPHGSYSKNLSMNWKTGQLTLRCLLPGCYWGHCLGSRHSSYLFHGFLTYSWLPVIFLSCLHRARNGYMTKL